MKTDNLEYDLKTLIFNLNKMEDDLVNTIELSESALMNAYRTIIPQKHMELISGFEEKMKKALRHLNPMEENFSFIKIDQLYSDNRELKQSSALKILNQVKQELERF